MVRPKQERPSDNDTDKASDNISDNVRENAGGYSDHLIDLCLALSREKDLTHLLDLIVSKSRQLTNAEAGSLYMVEGDVLSFEVLQNAPLDIHYKKQEKTAPPMPSVPLEKEGEPNLENVSSCVANTGLPIHIEDLYAPGQRVFSGVHAWDKSSGFRSVSMLALPLIGYKGEVVAVLQLINRKDEKTGEIQAFKPSDLHIMSAIASQAAIAIVKVKLIKDLQILMYSFVKAIAWAVDAKSHVTGEHINRVAGLTMRIAHLVNDTETGPFADMRFSDDNLDELKYAAWMHDVGKIITPWHLIEKSRKLEGILDGMTVIQQRFEVIKLSVEIQWLKDGKGGDGGGGGAAYEKELCRELKKIDDDYQFLVRCNDASQFMNDEGMARLMRIRNRTFITREGGTSHWLTEEEFELLGIKRGNLSAQERSVIEDHALMTRKILDNIQFPKHLSKVSLLASCHHEKPNGKGYPGRIKDKDIPLQAKIMAIADIYEALTARDRPYKKPMSPSQAEAILLKMKEGNEIDGALFDLCRQRGLFKKIPVSDDFLTD